jgi:hypothetical protein
MKAVPCTLYSTTILCAHSNCFKITVTERNFNFRQDSKDDIPTWLCFNNVSKFENFFRAGIFKQSMGQEGKEFIVPARKATQAGGIHSLESIPGLHKRIKMRAM